MVGDQHRLADGHALADPARGVGEHDRPAARRGGGAHAVRDGVDAVALVEVGAAEQHQHAPVADGHRADRAAVPGDGGRDEPGQVGHRHLVGGRAEDVGGRPPARAEHDGDVVRRDAGGLREGGGRRRGGCVGVMRRMPEPRRSGRRDSGPRSGVTASATTSNSRADTPSECPPGTVSRTASTPSRAGSTRSQRRAVHAVVRVR